MSCLLVRSFALLSYKTPCYTTQPRTDPRTLHPPDDHLYIEEWRNAMRRFWSRLNSLGICRVGQSLKGIIPQTSGRMWMGKDQLINFAWRFHCLLFLSPYTSEGCPWIGFVFSSARNGSINLSTNHRASWLFAEAPHTATSYPRISTRSHELDLSTEKRPLQ